MRNALLIASSLVLFGLAVVACGSDDTHETPGSGGSGAGGAAGTGSGEGGDGSGGDGTGGDSSGGDASGGEASGEGGSGEGGEGGEEFNGQSGYVSLNQTKMTIPTGSLVNYAVTASFTKITYWGQGGNNCDISSEGACTVYKCDTSAPGTSIEYVAAGTITITGGKAPLTLAFDAGTGIYSTYATDLLWSDGATLTVSASGGVVPAFSATVTGVAQVVLVKPALPAAGVKLPVSTNGPMAFQWSGSSVGTITAMMSQSTTAPSVTVRCVFDASAGAGSAPAAAMNAFPAGASGTLTVLGSETKDAAVPDWTVNVSTNMVAAKPDGTLASGEVTFM